MRALLAGFILCIVASLLLWAQVAAPVITIGPAQCLTQASAGADTNQFSAWTAAGGGGNFNTGHVYGNAVNDGRFPNSQAGTTGHMQFLEVTAIAPFNVSNTSLTVINPMADYDHTVFTYYGQSSRGIYGSHPWSNGGKIYFPLHIQDQGDPFGTYTTFILITPDSGVHWCNYAHYVANSNVCNSGAPWSTTGDIPASNGSGDMQWPTALTNGNAPNSYMGKLTIMQTIQDGASSPTIPGVDTTYDYFLSNREPGSGAGANNNHQLHAHRVLRSADPMIPTNWTHWNGSTWVANSSLATVVDVSPSAWSAGGCFANSGMYDTVLKLYFVAASCFNLSPLLQFATGTSPQGPFTVVSYTAPTASNAYQFPSFILATKTAYMGNRGFSVQLSTNGLSGDAQTPVFNTIGFEQINVVAPSVSAGVRISQ